MPVAGRSGAGRRWRAGPKASSCRAEGTDSLYWVGRRRSLWRGWRVKIKREGKLMDCDAASCTMRFASRLKSSRLGVASWGGTAFNPRPSLAHPSHGDAWQARLKSTDG